MQHRQRTTFAWKAFENSRLGYSAAGVCTGIPLRKTWVNHGPQCQSVELVGGHGWVSGGLLGDEPSARAQTTPSTGRNRRHRRQQTVPSGTHFEKTPWGSLHSARGLAWKPLWSPCLGAGQNELPSARRARGQLLASRGAGDWSRRAPTPVKGWVEAGRTEMRATEI